jgi:hypothetical protein
VALPHRFPFQFVAQKEGRVAILWTGSAWWSRGQTMPRTLLVEVLAQAALAHLGAAQAQGTAPSHLGTVAGTPFLAGLEEVEFLRDVVPGDGFEIEVALEASLGQIHRLRALLRDRHGAVIRGSLLVGS